MDPNVWEQWDERLLEILGNVRHNEDTTMGKRYTPAFYRAFAGRISRESNLAFSALDCGIRICGLREIFQSWRVSFYQNFAEKLSLKFWKVWLGLKPLPGSICN